MTSKMKAGDPTVSLDLLVKSVPVSDKTARAGRRVAQLLSQADALLVTAGAGMGADSGLPVFRGNEGFWRAYPPLKQLGISFERMAQPYWFRDRPRMAWAFYGHRLQLYREAKPHRGYALLEGWVRGMSAGGFAVTSNVDGQFLAAGFAEERVVEQHGSIHRLQCSVPCSQESWETGSLDLRIDLDALEARGELPTCPKCGALARPNILMFNDGDWVADVVREQSRRFDAWLAGVRGRRLVVLEIGAGTALPTIRRMGERIAQRPLTTLVRINPEEREGDDSTLVLPLGGLQALELIEQSLPDRSRDRPAQPQPALQRSVETRFRDDSLTPLPPREMETIEFREVRPRATAAGMAERLKLKRLEEIHLVSLRAGTIVTVSPFLLTADEEERCLLSWYAAQSGFVPLPEIRGLAAPGFTFSGRAVRRSGNADDGPPGGAFFCVKSSAGEFVSSVAMARRPMDGAYLWRRLHELAHTPVQAMEYPPEPWIGRLLEGGAARNSAMLETLYALECAIALSWLKCQMLGEWLGREGE